MRQQNGWWVVYLVVEEGCLRTDLGISRFVEYVDNEGFHGLGKIPDLCHDAVKDMEWRPENIRGGPS